MKIYDCFSYWDEDLLLELRLNILNEYVDYFVIVEGNKTWQNNYKKLRFNINNFQKFENKIIYIPVEDLPDGDNPYLRENFQRNAISRGFEKVEDDDLVIISDLDEIPNPEKIQSFKKSMKYAVFEQMHFYYKINLQSQFNPKWYGSRICIKKYLKSPQWLRSQKIKKYPFWKFNKIKWNIIKNGGWHFSYLMSPEEIKKKLASFAHSEYNNRKYTNLKKIEDSIKNKKDLFDRPILYEKNTFDKTFPDYVVNNKEKFKDWILK